jgi:phospholipase C
MKRVSVFIILVLAALVAAACNSSSSMHNVVPNASMNGLERRHASSSPITHIVIIMQENRSFDNMFYAFPGANTATYGYGHGTKYVLQPHALVNKLDPNHEHYQFLEDYDGGKNDGFDLIITGNNGVGKCKQWTYNWVNEPQCFAFRPASYYKLPFSYVRRSDIQPYWTMASRYTLGDDNFASNSGPSYGAHLELVAGQIAHADEVPSAMPWGCDAPKNPPTWEYYLRYGQANPPAFPAIFGHNVKGPNPCFTFTSIAKKLDAAKVSWRWYKQPTPAPSEPQQDSSGFNKYDSDWLDAFDSIKAVRYGPDEKNIVTPDTQVLTDIANNNLAQVSWVMPHEGASDHGGVKSGACGPAWVTAIVNAIGKSPYWGSTAIVISWDEWGGWFDHVVPPQYPNLETGAYEGLGYRTPLIIISAYAKQHYISHSEHETASALHFIERTFLGGQTLGLDDKRADYYQDVFNYSQQPTKFTKIPEPSDYQQCMSVQNPGPEIDY